MKLDNQARYAKSHEWARKEGTDLVIGISDHAQESLGDIVFVDLPKAGSHFTAGVTFGVVESVKAASDLYLPVEGTVTAINTALAEKPDLVNKDCYGDGWLIKITPANPQQWDTLLSAQEYEKIAAEA
jgi:glycine cleavage system H protein